MKPLNDIEWKKLQEFVKEQDQNYGHQIGVNIYAIKITIPDQKWRSCKNEINI